MNKTQQNDTALWNSHLLIETIGEGGDDDRKLLAFYPVDLTWSTVIVCGLKQSVFSPPALGGRRKGERELGSAFVCLFVCLFFVFVCWFGLVWFGLVVCLVVCLFFLRGECASGEIISRNVSMQVL